MNEADALELLRAAIWTIIIASGPAVAAAMFVGLVIALLQALTQVQETTLTFVPKIVAMMHLLSSRNSKDKKKSQIFLFAGQFPAAAFGPERRWRACKALDPGDKFPKLRLLIVQVGNLRCNEKEQC